MKKIIFIIFLLFIGVVNVKANNYCEKSAVEEFAKITFQEVGPTLNNNLDEDFFAKLTTAAVILNNVERLDGNSFLDKVSNLNGSLYGGYANYKNISFYDYVPASEQSKMLYISGLILSGKYTLPKTMLCQADLWDCEQWANIWTKVDVTCSGCRTVYFGYSKWLPFESIDVFGNTLSSTDPSYYRSLATSLRKTEYSSYNISNVCDYSEEEQSTIIDDNGNSSDGKIEPKKKAYVEPKYDCTNPNIKKAIGVVSEILLWLRILVPIILVIIGTISFAKAVVSQDEKEINETTRLLIKKIIIGVLIFVIPTIIIVGMKSLVEKYNTDDSSWVECINLLK